MQKSLRKISKVLSKKGLIYTLLHLDNLNIKTIRFPSVYLPRLRPKYAFSVKQDLARNMPGMCQDTRDRMCVLRLGIYDSTAICPQKPILPTPPAGVLPPNLYFAHFNLCQIVAKMQNALCSGRRLRPNGGIPFPAPSRCPYSSLAPRPFRPFLIFFLLLPC